MDIYEEKLMYITCVFLSCLKHTKSTQLTLQATGKIFSLKVTTEAFRYDFKLTVSVLLSVLSIVRMNAALS